MIKKTRPHITQNEPLLFERSSPGKKGYQLPDLDVPAVDPVAALGPQNTRAEIEDFPEVSEVDAIRHFTRLSTWNYAIDLGLYPLGSCTMKYNPRVNEHVARIEGLAWIHPYQADALSQGAMNIMAASEQALLAITGMDAVTLQPAAGAHGELTGILLIRAMLESNGNPRKKVIVPDSAHGTNPASVHMAGYEVVHIASNDHGMVDTSALERMVDGDVAALMVTNPNTVGVFEEHIRDIARILHAKGAMVYMDGANMNALVGIARPGDFGVDVMHLNLHKTFSTPHGGGGPGSGPVAVKQHLEPYLPLPRLQRVEEAWRWNYDRPHSIGRVRAFYGNFRRAGARAGLHHGAWRRWVEASHAGRAAECHLSPQALGALLSDRLPSSEHARMRLQRQPSSRARRLHRRHCKTVNRLRLPSLHRQLPL